MAGNRLSMLGQCAQYATHLCPYFVELGPPCTLPQISEITDGFRLRAAAIASKFTVWTNRRNWQPRDWKRLKNTDWVLNLSPVHWRSPFNPCKSGGLQRVNSSPGTLKNKSNCSLHAWVYAKVVSSMYKSIWLMIAHNEPRYMPSKTTQSCGSQNEWWCYADKPLVSLLNCITLQYPKRQP